MVRLNSNLTLKGPGGGGRWHGKAIIDNGAPFTVVDNSVLRSLGEPPNGKYCPGNGSNPLCVIQPGYSLYDLDIKTDVSPYQRIEVAASNLKIGAGVLLGMDWLTAANPDIDWANRTLMPKSGGTFGGYTYPSESSGTTSYDHGHRRNRRSRQDSSSSDDSVDFEEAMRRLDRKMAKLPFCVRLDSEEEGADR